MGKRDADQLSNEALTGRSKPLHHQRVLPAERQLLAQSKHWLTSAFDAQMVLRRPQRLAFGQSSSYDNGSFTTLYELHLRRNYQQQ
jgi:hypothetical protein